MNSQLENVLIEVEKAVAGKREVIKKLIMALLADGHVLLDDVPFFFKSTVYLRDLHSLPPRRTSVL